MKRRTAIEWAYATWNPVTGCTAFSPGCDHCYARRMAIKLQALGVAKYRHGFRLTLHRDVLRNPLEWKRPHRVFVNSMSDLFHEEVPLEFIQEVFAVMRRADRHLFQILTKRSKRLVRVAHRLPWPENVWMGVTVENRHYRYRIDDLRKVPARVRFLSLEPLLGPLGELDLTGIHWAIVGGESGPGARPMRAEWVRDIRRQCQEQSVAFFFKQWGGTNRKRAGRTLDGRTWNDMPLPPNRQLVLSID